MKTKIATRWWFVSWGLLFSALAVMADAMTVVPEADAERDVAEIVFMILATLSFLLALFFRPPKS